MKGMDALIQQEASLAQSGAAITPAEKLALMIVEHFEEALLSIERLLAEDGEEIAKTTKTKKLGSHLIDSGFAAWGKLAQNPFCTLLWFL